VQVSVVIPVFNEEDCIGPLLEEIAAAAAAALPLKEILVVDDGSADGTAGAVMSLKGKIPGLRLIRHRERRGQSTAIHTGIARATGDLIVTLDGDGQNDPRDIPLLYKAYLDAAASGPRILVAGQRRKRRDNAVRRISSRVANGIRASILDDGVRDTGCSLKLFRREDFLALPFFDHIHRFIPALMKASGVRVILVDVSHRPRERGISKYGVWDRLWVGIHDLIGVSWLISRGRNEVGVEEQ
jgi:dolichol-phosphate mannosyltransferase